MSASSCPDSMSPLVLSGTQPARAAVEAPGAPWLRWGREATGTFWTVLTRRPLPAALREELAARMEAFEQVWSRFRRDSLVRRAARGELVDETSGAVVLALPPGSQVLLDLYDRLHRATGGAVDPLVGADLLELGYDPRHTFTVRDGAAQRLGAVHGRTTWEAAARYTGDRLQLSGPLLLDVGAAGKGFLADQLADWLGAAGFDELVVDAGGDILVRSAQPVRVGLERPAHPGQPPQVVGVVEIAEGAVCASGTARRTWGPDLHHILDAVTGLPVTGTAAVSASWVVADTCAEADGLATALFVTDPAVLAHAGFAFDFALLRRDGSAAVSRGFRDLPAEIFTA